MDTNFDPSFIRSIFPTYKNYLFLSYSLLQKVLYRDLPHDILETLCSVQFCLSHMNRMNNLFEYITSDSGTAKITARENFDPENILTEFTNVFEKTISDYVDVSISCSSKLSKTVPIVINKTRFELLFLNLLYCSVQSIDPTASSRAKITLYLTETKNNIVFHIRDNCRSMRQEIVESVFSKKPLPNFDDCSADAVIAFSLEGALRSANDQNYKLSYKALKSGNRYDISIPKFHPNQGEFARSLSTYVSTTLFFEETFADIKLEQILKRKISEVNEK